MLFVCYVRVYPSRFFRLWKSKMGKKLTLIAQRFSCNAIPFNLVETKFQFLWNNNFSRFYSVRCSLSIFLSTAWKLRLSFPQNMVYMACIKHMLWKSIVQFLTNNFHFPFQLFSLLALILAVFWYYCWVQRCHKYDEFIRTKTPKSKGMHKEREPKETTTPSHLTMNEWGTHMAIWMIKSDIFLCTTRKCF